MHIEEIGLTDCRVIQSTLAADERGSLMKPFQKEFFAENSLWSNFSEALTTVSKQNVIRGMHYQAPPYSSIKLVWVTSGIILDVVLGIRGKDTGKTYYEMLCGEVPRALYIGRDYAHGFRVVSQVAVVNYLISEPYRSDHDRGIRWDSFGFNWNIKDPIISNKDQFLPIFIPGEQ